MNRAPLFSFLCFFLMLAFFNGDETSRQDLMRVPASVGGGCFEKMAFLLASKDPHGKVSLWKKMLSLPEGDFKGSDYLVYQQDLKELTGDDFIPANQSPEAIMAYIKVSGERLGIKEEFDPDKWSRFKRGQFEKIIRRLKKRRRLETASLEELTSELFIAAYGPDFKWRHFFSEDLARKRLVLRAAQEDLVSRGMFRMFSDYRHPASFIQRFSQTPWGKGLLTGLLNLPVLSGLPPLYLPSLKKRGISEALGRELLEEGINEQTLIKIERELGESLVDRNRYEAIRRSYIAGAMTFVTLAGIYDMVQLNKVIDEEAEDIEMAKEEADEFLEVGEILKEENIDIFAEESYIAGQSFCEAIEECVASLEDVPMCQDLMDPDSRCKSE
ncbi:MAG: hypothetical protein VXV96_10625 [Bdellovibrionota bacterium]|nr:hypothetical protein [Bdellovibrionota bacterium]